MDNPRYWAYTGLRTGFFLASGLYSANKNGLEIFHNRKSEDAQKLSADKNSEKENERLEMLVDLLQDYEKMADIDAENIKKGLYRAPWTNQVGHRELNPAWANMKSKEFIKEAKENLSRRKRQGR